MTSHGNEMEQKNKQQFEDQLKEILYSGPDNNVQNSVEKAESRVHFLSHIEKRHSSSAEILIRIIAALMVIGLLICFGIQIAFR